MRKGGKERGRKGRGEIWREGREGREGRTPKFIFLATPLVTQGKQSQLVT